MTDPILPTLTRRQPAPQLPSDPAEAEAMTAALIRGAATPLPQAALEAQRRRVEALRDPLATSSLDELARQLPTLEALWQRFAVESMTASSPETRFKYLKAALHAQQAFARTFALLRTLRYQQQGGGVSIEVHGDDAD